VSSLATRRRGPLVVAVLAALAHLVGFFYLAGGLVVPGYVLIPLWIVWIVLAAVLVRLAMGESWWTPSVPVGALALFLVVITVGEKALGWTA
jgi:hypothetical protein